MLVIEVSGVIVIFGIPGAFLDAGTAFDTDTRDFFHVVGVDRAHGADFGAQSAVIAAVVGKGFHLAYVYRVAVTVAGRVIPAIGIRGAGYFDEGRFRGERVARGGNVKREGGGGVEVARVGTVFREDAGERVFPDESGGGDGVEPAAGEDVPKFDEGIVVIPVSEHGDGYCQSPVTRDGGEVGE